MPSIRIRKSIMAGLLSLLICVAFAESTVRPLAQKNSGAQEAMDRAEALRAGWIHASLQQAIAEYEKAAQLWTSASDFANASQATLNSGDVYFLFSDYNEALKRFQQAEALARSGGDWLGEAKALSRMGRLQSFIGKNELAQQQLTKALDLFKQHESDRSASATTAYGEALSNLAEVNYAKGDFVKSREQFKTALEILQNDRKGEARVRLFNGYIAGSLGELEKAVTEINRALELYREVNDKIGEALALTALGLSYSHKGENDRATEVHRNAIEIFRTVGNRHSEAISHNALGQSYERVSQYQLAMSEYEQALRLFEEIGTVDGMSVAAYQLARVLNASGNPDQAIALYERCLQLSRTAGLVRTEANALNEIANIYAAQGRHELASSQYEKVQKFYESIGDLRDQAIALNAYGDFLLKLGQKQKALEAYRRAHPLSEKVGDKGILITTLYNLGRANLAAGSPDAALSSIRRSLEIIEDLRANEASPDFRVSYLSGVRKHYELCIEILMQLDRLRPGEGLAAEALLVSEKGRARLLLDLVSESQATLRQGAAKELLDRERELRGLFGAQAQYRMDLLLSKKDSAELAAIDNQLAQLRAEYQQVQATIRQQHPRLFSLQEPLNLQQIQNELRAGDTMLLEYALGDERSYLWAVTSSSIQSYELASRVRIEEAARDFYKTLTARQGSVDKNYRANVEAADDAYLEKATRLSQMLLGPLAGQLGNKRLIVVTEGALQHIPLDALPEPVTGRSETFMIENHEVVVLPSVSALIAIRGARNRTSSPNKVLAVIADPVFSGNDDRVQSGPVSRGVAQAADDKKPRRRDGQLARLAYASEEADAISAVAPWGTTLVAKGFDATRETAMSSDVGQYQILHFATHGFLNSDHPELSGIVLSTVDSNGNETNGVMPLHDIYSLDLSAELTVLSACQTALGKDIRGEGLVGLTHSFMSAGSKSVVASLWKVDDRATAILMADFYESMLQQGMSPAAALRSAKLKLMKDKNWGAPYYWAGFVFQGEYTNRIAVARRSWLGPGLALFSLLVVAAALLIYRRRKQPPAPAQTA